WHQGERPPGGDHVIGVTAVERDAGDFDPRLAGKELAATAGVAVATVPRMPANPNPLAGLPARGDILPHFVDGSDHFVSRDAGELEPRPETFLGERIAMADATCLDLEPDMF